MDVWWWLSLAGAGAAGALVTAIFLARRRPAAGTEPRTDVEHLAAELQARQQKAMEALRLNQARWQTLAEALTAGVVLLGRDRRILLTNTAARRALAALGTPDGATTLESLGPSALEDVLSRHRDPEPVEIRIEGDRPRVFEAHASPIVAGAGGEWVLTLSEVTAERETARKLWLRERLAAVGQLAAGIAHDFNNILQSITLASEMSRQRIAGDAARPPVTAADEAQELADNLDIILHQARRAAELVRQILDFARQSPTRSRNLELGPFIEEVIALLRRTLPESVTWDLELGGGHRVQADPAQLQQLLTNLVVNADAAMPEGGTLRLALGQVTFEQVEDKPFRMMEAGPWVTLTVSDTGSGMPAGVVKRIFEPFYTTKGRTQGTGLGLAQVYGIVKQQGGFIDVASEVGRGTEFKIFLPPAGAGDGEAPAEAAPVEIPEGRGERVLVVDDDEAILRGARMALLSFGYRVLTASDGASAAELFERHGDDIRLVLSDVEMSGVGGFELARRLRERNPEVAVLFMSGYAPRTLEDGPLVRGNVAGAVPEDAECLAKPFSLDELAEAISRVLRRAGGSRDMLGG